MIGQLARRALFQLYSGGVRTGEWAIMIVNAATATQFRALLEEASAGKAWCGTARSAFRQGSTVLGDLSYGYDLSGNRTSVGGSWARTGLPAAVSTTAYDDANELTTWGGGSLTYDADGNLRTEGTNTYTFD